MDLESKGLYGGDKGTGQEAGSEGRLQTSLPRRHSAPSPRLLTHRQQNLRPARGGERVKMSSWTQREGCAAKFVPLEAPFLPTARSRHVTDRGAPETSGEEGGDSRRDGGNLRAALGGHVSSILVGPSWGRGWGI